MSGDRQPIGVIGTGYVGLVTAAGFAQLGSDVWCVDIDAEKIARLERGEIPIYEPGLAECIVANRERLHFSTELAPALEHTRLMFVAVGTPPTYSGDADLSAVYAVVDAMPPSGRHGRRDQAPVRGDREGGLPLRVVSGVPQGGHGAPGLPPPRPGRRRRRR